MIPLNLPSSQCVYNIGLEHLYLLPDGFVFHFDYDYVIVKYLCF